MYFLSRFKATLTALTASAIGYDSYLSNANTACCD